MRPQITEKKLLEIFIGCDDFCQHFESWAKENRPGVLQPIRGGLCSGEIMTILIAYHLSGYKNFEYFYREWVLELHQNDFPGAMSYKRFLCYIRRVFDYMFVYLMWLLKNTFRSGTYFMDSTKIPAYHYLRRYSHKVFDGIAQIGKTSTGWFYGLKIHLIINHLGDLVKVEITAGNVADNDHTLLQKMLAGLTGTVFADKGYLTKLFQYFHEKGLTLITKVRKNMKNQLMPLPQRKVLAQRGIIESVFDLLKTVCNVDHTRHRSPINALTHMFAGLIAYQFMDDKPALILNNCFSAAA